MNPAHINNTFGSRLNRVQHG